MDPYLSTENKPSIQAAMKRVSVHISPLFNTGKGFKGTNNPGVVQRWRRGSGCNEKFFAVVFITHCNLQLQFRLDARSIEWTSMALLWVTHSSKPVHVIRPATVRYHKAGQLRPSARVRLSALKRLHSARARSPDKPQTPSGASLSSRAAARAFVSINYGSFVLGQNRKFQPSMIKVRLPVAILRSPHMTSGGACCGRSDPLFRSTRALTQDGVQCFNIYASTIVSKPVKIIMPAPSFLCRCGPKSHVCQGSSPN